MVVTRKTPVAPALPASRSNSSQPIPRATKGKTVASQTTESRALNGDESSSSRRTDGSLSKGQEVSSFVHFDFFLSFLWKHGRIVSLGCNFTVHLHAPKLV